MLTKVEARTTTGLLLVLPLDNISNGYVMQDILGLDPVKATIVTSDVAQIDGSQYQASRRESRNIIFQVGLEPDYVTKTIRQLRTGLYTFFMPKTQVSLRFYMSTGLIVEISARVESCESVLFSKEPLVNISLICFNPDFLELEPVVVTGETVSTSTEFVIDYGVDGTVETGFQFVLNVDRALSEFTIYHRPPDNIIRTLDFAASLIAGDVLTINTVLGSKEVSLLRASTLSSLLYGLSPQSNWIDIHPGDNYYRVYALGVSIPFSMTYTTRHGGL